MCVVGRIGVVCCAGVNYGPGGEGEYVAIERLLHDMGISCAYRRYRLNSKEPCGYRESIFVPTDARCHTFKCNDV